MDIVATRELSVKQDNQMKPAYLHIYKPYQDQKSHWQCDYELVGFSKNRRFSAAGEDSFQALLLAVKMSVVDLSVTSEYKSGNLFSFDEALTGPDLFLEKGWLS